MSDKRQLLVETALQLFYQQGINSVGINEVLKVSGVAKKTLYHHFPSKEELILAALHLRHARFISWLEKLLPDARSDAELIERLFKGLYAWFGSKVPELGEFRGCFFINTSAEFSQKEHEITRYCFAHKEEVRQLIGKHLKNPADGLLDAICLFKEGAIVSAYVCRDNTSALTCIPILTQMQKQ